MMPMVFSATASSMPAFAASCPISSSILPRPRPVTCRILACEFILIFRVTNYKRSPHAKAIFIRDRVAVLHRCKSERGIYGYLSPVRRPHYNFRPPIERHRSILISKHRAASDRLPIPGEGVERFQSACKMQYDGAVWRLKPLTEALGGRAKRRCNGERPKPRWPIPATGFSSARATAGLADAWARQPPRSRHRRHRNRQDRVAAGDGRGICARRRSGVRRRHQGRPLRHRRSRARPRISSSSARQGNGPRLPARPVLDRVLGRVRRAGPSGPRHGHRNGAAVAVADARPQRRAGGRAQRRLPRRGRKRPDADRHEGSAGAAGRDRSRHRQERPGCRGGSAGADPQGRAGLRQRHQGDRRHHSTPASGAGKPGRRQVLRRAGAGAEGFHEDRSATGAAWSTFWSPTS